MKRILDNKKIEETIKEYEKGQHSSWKELAQTLNNKFELELSESAYRKIIQSNDRVNIALSDNEDQRLGKYVAKEIKIFNEEQFLKGLKKGIKEEKKELANFNVIFELMNAMVKPLKAPKYVFEKEESDKTNLFIISDIQEDGSGFSHEVLQKVEQEIIDRVKSEKLKEIYILENGDGIDGCLRVSDLYNNFGGVVSQLQHYSTALMNLLNNVSKYTRINFSIVNSNHTELRPMGTKKGEIKKEDITILILNFLKTTLKDNQNINWLNKDTTNPLDLNHNKFFVNGYKIFQHHYDMGGSNPNNLDNTYNKILTYYDKNIDIVIGAHYHHWVFKHINKINDGRVGNTCVVLNPALDPRLHKQNEEMLMVSSEPAFLRIVIEKNKGLTLQEQILTGIYR